MTRAEIRYAVLRFFYNERGNDRAGATEAAFAASALGIRPEQVIVACMYMFGRVWLEGRFESRPDGPAFVGRITVRGISQIADSDRHDP